MTIPVELIFEALIGVAVVVGTFFFRRLDSTMKDLQTAVVDLRVEVSKTHADHGARLTTVEREVGELKDRMKDLTGPREAS